MARDNSTVTRTLFLPEPDNAYGVDVIVAPGGGFRWQSMGNDGWEVSKAIAEQGIDGFVPKYHLHPPSSTLSALHQEANRDSIRLLRM